jgi:hypothetical protein
MFSTLATLSSSRAIRLPDLAPHPGLSGRLPRLHRAGPSASLDKSAFGAIRLGGMIPRVGAPRQILLHRGRCQNQPFRAEDDSGRRRQVAVQGPVRPRGGQLPGHDVVVFRCRLQQAPEEVPAGAERQIEPPHVPPASAGACRWQGRPGSSRRHGPSPAAASHTARRPDTPRFQDGRYMPDDRYACIPCQSLRLRANLMSRGGLRSAQVTNRPLTGAAFPGR